MKPILIKKQPVTSIALRAVFVLALMLFFTAVVTNAGELNKDGFKAQERLAKDMRMEGPVTIGEIEAYHMELELKKQNTWRQTIYFPKASFIKIHFEKFNPLPGDYLTISNPGGEEVLTYPDGPGFTLDQNGGFWAMSIGGDTAVIKFHSVHDISEYAASDRIVVDQFTHGYPWDKIRGHFEGKKTESTCGTNQRTDVACYQNSHPTEFSRSHSVARLVLNNGTNLCTSWRAGKYNHMLTNEHCISSQQDVSAAEAWFNYQRTTCQGGSMGAVTKARGDRFITGNANLDFALFSVQNFSSLSSFGYLDLDVRAPVLGEQIYIPQHGAGNPKEFGIESDVNTGNLCRIDDDTINGYGSNTDTGYGCDTTGGSSGSPVLATSSHKVIALHHLGISGSTCTLNAMNQGVRIEKIWPFISQFLGAATITPDAKANGSDTSITINSSDKLTLNVSLATAGNTNSADWWVLAQNSAGSWFYYNLATQSFQAGANATHQGPLFDLGSYQVFNSAGLPQGTYTFTFAVDLTPDGSQTKGSGQWYSDSVVINVQKVVGEK